MCDVSCKYTKVGTVDVNKYRTILCLNNLFTYTKSNLLILLQTNIYMY